MSFGRKAESHLFIFSLNYNKNKYSLNFLFLNMCLLLTEPSFKYRFHDLKRLEPQSHSHGLLLLSFTIASMFLCGYFFTTLVLNLMDRAQWWIYACSCSVIEKMEKMNTSVRPRLQHKKPLVTVSHERVIKFGQTRFNYVLCIFLKSGCYSTSSSFITIIAIKLWFCLLLLLIVIMIA